MSDPDTIREALGSARECDIEHLAHEAIAALARLEARLRTLEENGRRLADKNVEIQRWADGKIEAQKARLRTLEDALERIRDKGGTRQDVRKWADVALAAAEEKP